MTDVEVCLNEGEISLIDALLISVATAERKRIIGNVATYSDPCQQAILGTLAGNLWADSLIVGCEIEKESFPELAKDMAKEFGKVTNEMRKKWAKKPVPVAPADAEQMDLFIGGGV